MSLSLLANSVTQSPCFAYLGPGTGVMGIAILMAIGVGLLLAIAGFFWYPIKILLKSNDDSIEEDD